MTIYTYTRVYMNIHICASIFIYGTYIYTYDIHVYMHVILAQSLRLDYSVLNREFRLQGGNDGMDVHRSPYKAPSMVVLRIHAKSAVGSIWRFHLWC